MSPTTFTGPVSVNSHAPVSTTDPDAMLARKSRGTPALLSYRGHLLTENHNGLVVSTRTTQAYGEAERHAALLTARGDSGNGRVTLGADKGYDVRDFVGEPRHMTSHRT